MFRRRPEILITSVEMTDWQMLVEKWPGGKNNFPRFVNNDQPDTWSATVHDDAEVPAGVARKVHL